MAFQNFLRQPKISLNVELKIYHHNELQLLKMKVIPFVRIKFKEILF